MGTPKLLRRTALSLSTDSLPDIVPPSPTSVRGSHGGKTTAFSKPTPIISVQQRMRPRHSVISDSHLINVRPISVPPPVRLARKEINPPISFGNHP